MIYEIKQAIADKIKELYPTVTIYDEYIPQGFKGGSFFISVIDYSHNKVIGEKYNASVSFDLSYFPAAKNSINNECYQVSQNIMRTFDLLNGYRIRNKSSSITDDVLHVQFTVKYREIKSQTEIKMNDITFE